QRYCRTAGAQSPQQSEPVYSRHAHVADNAARLDSLAARQQLLASNIAAHRVAAVFEQFHEGSPHILIVFNDMDDTFARQKDYLHDCTSRGHWLTASPTNGRLISTISA